MLSFYNSSDYPFKKKAENLIKIDFFRKSQKIDKI
jgi:hypothetical protein